jgi:Transposase DDE domain
MQDKWNVKKKGYLKIHIAVNIKSKKILSMKVTDEHVHDSKALLGITRIRPFILDFYYR